MIIPENYAGSMQQVTQMLDTLKFKPGAFVLDCGCGDAFISSAIKKLSGAIVVGIDLDPRRLKRFGSSAIERCVADVRYFPFRNACFDYVICNNVLEHVGESSKVLLEIARATKIDSALYLSIPNSYSDVAFFLKSINRKLDIVAGHVKHFSLNELIDLLESANFRCFDYYYSSFVLGWLTDFAIVGRKKSSNPNLTNQNSIKKKTNHIRLLLNGYIEVWAKFEQWFLRRFRRCSQISIYARKKDQNTLE